MCNYRVPSERVPVGLRQFEGQFRSPLHRNRVLRFVRGFSYSFCFAKSPRVTVSVKSWLRFRREFENFLRKIRETRISGLFLCPSFWIPSNVTDSQLGQLGHHICCKTMDCESSRSLRSFSMLLVVMLITMIVNCAMGLSRDSAFLGYSERPLVTPQYYGYPQRPKEHLVFSTEYGNITVELRREMAFKTVRYVKSLVSRGLFDGCGFYRAEPPGPTIDAGKLESRKGYALVQGGLYSCGRQENKDLPLETKLDNSKGTVALITGTSEFFFSLEDHYEWNGSFSVFGTMIGEPSWRTLEELVALPTRQEVHPSGTVMRILVKPVIFKAIIERHFYPPSVGLHSS